MSRGLPSPGGTSSTCRRLFYAPCGTQRNRLLTSSGPANPEQSRSLAPATHNPRESKALRLNQAAWLEWEGEAPRTPAPRRPPPAQGLGSAGGVGEGRGPMIWLKLEVAQRGLLLPRLYTAPEGGSQDSANSWAQPGLQGRPWTCGSHRRRGSEADTGATRGRVGGLLGAGSATLVRGVVAAEDKGHAPPETRGTR